MAQTIATTIGDTYTIQFDYCGVEGCFGSAPNSSWSVQVDGVAVLVTAIDAGTMWVTDSVSFVAVNANTVICFMRDITTAGQGGIDNLSVHADLTTGIGENGFGQDLVVLPNPSTGTFIVDLGDGSFNMFITLVDLSGRPISTRTSNGARYVTIGTDLPAGIYFLVLDTGAKRSVRRLVKE